MTQDFAVWTGFIIFHGLKALTGSLGTVIGGDYSTEYSLDIKGECKESKFSVYFDKLWHNKGALTFTVESPLLWWARDMGEQNLYRVTATLYHGKEIVDTTEFNFGIRTVRLVKSDTTDNSGNGEFCFYVNGVRTYITAVRRQNRLRGLYPLKSCGCGRTMMNGGSIRQVWKQIPAGLTITEFL